MWRCPNITVCEDFANIARSCCASIAAVGGGFWNVTSGASLATVSNIHDCASVTAGGAYSSIAVCDACASTAASSSCSKVTFGISCAIIAISCVS